MGLSIPTTVTPRITPLANLLRPATLDEVIGQKHLIGPGGPIRKMAETGKLTSLILWGVPGIGKTTIVRALSKDASANFVSLNATSAKVEDIRKTLKEAALENQGGRQTICFIDEIHRFSKSQQDVLLPGVEDGTIVLVGATTEMPKYAVNPTLLSRTSVFELHPLSFEDMITLVKRVRSYYKEKGHPLSIQKDAAKELIVKCSGDARKLITAMEMIVEVLAADKSDVTVEMVNEAMPEKHVVFDRFGSEHFDHAHAMQQALQHSDADAAIYWLAKWFASGEDPTYIARRILVAAYEDGGDSIMAMTSAAASMYAAEKIGPPECFIPMSHAVIAIAQAGRSKIAYRAIKNALEDVERNETIHIPPGLRAGQHGYTAAINKVYVHGDLVKDGRLRDQDEPD